MTADHEQFAERVANFVERWGSARLLAAADALTGGEPTLIGPSQTAAFHELVAAKEQYAIPDNEAAAYLRGVAAGYVHQSATRVEVTWTGPSTHHVPVRATAQVLVDLARNAEHELVLLTYSAKPYPPLLESLIAAIARGVRVSVVVETLTGAGSALAGDEPAAAFATVPGLHLWHWPVGQRTESGAKMHAKLAVADRRILLVSSANLTQSGVAKNIEAGLLVRGGSAPTRAVEHVAALQAAGVLMPLPRSTNG